MEDHTQRRRGFITTALLCAMPFTAAFAQSVDPLPSWNEREARQALVTFVSKVTSEGGPQFVPPAERIATFDNDGTLWAEQPLYFQFLFAIDRVKALAPQRPEWKDPKPFKSLLAGDVKAARGLDGNGHETRTAHELDAAVGT